MVYFLLLWSFISETFVTMVTVWFIIELYVDKNAKEIFFYILYVAKIKTRMSCWRVYKCVRAAELQPALPNMISRVALNFFIYNPVQNDHIIIMEELELIFILFLQVKPNVQLTMQSECRRPFAVCAFAFSFLTIRVLTVVLLYCSNKMNSPLLS